MRYARTASVVLAFIMCVTAWGQQKVYLGDSGVEPRTPLRNRTGGDLFVMAKLPNAPLLDRPSSIGSPLPHRASFREVFTAYLEDNTRSFLLVKAKADPPIWGWMRKDDLLTDLECKRSEDKSNPAFVKVALKNNLRVSVAELVHLYAGPGTQYGIVETNGLAQILYVFDQRKGTDQNTYLLLGWDPTWNPDLPTDSIRGWARKEECTIWNHRVAVYYNRKNIDKRAKVSIFRTVDELRAGDARAALAVETTDSDRQLTFDRARFPVLQEASQASPMKIAFIGAPPRNLRITPNEVNVLKEAARNVQVLFLIDGTISMGRYFKEVQKAVLDYIKERESMDEKARHHFAVAVYRDYADGQGVYGEMNVIADFGDPRALDILGGLQEKSDPGDHDLPEAVFNGIVRSVKEVSWERGMLKSVVVIGDHPNHVPDPRGLTVQTVVRDLHTLMSARNLNSGFRFNAINVNVSDKYRYLNNEFVNQMKQIGNQFKPAGRFEQIETRPGDLDAFRSAIRNVLQDILGTTNMLMQAYDDTEKGKSANELAATYGTTFTEMFFKMLQEQGVRPEVINQSGLSQLSAEGWVPMVANGEQLFEPWVYIERRELDEFIGFLATLMQSSENRTRASEIIKEGVMRATGDPLLKNETIESYIKRAYSLPFRGDSAILSRTPEQLQEAIATQNLWVQFRKKIGYSYEALKLVNEERDPSALRWDEAHYKWVRTIDRPAEKRSWVTSSGGQKFVWVPLEYMP